MEEVKLKRYDVFATQLVDCRIEIEAKNKQDAMAKAADIVWEEWRREPNGFDIEEAIEIEDVGYSRYW